MKGNKVCALTNIVLGTSEEQVIIMAPYSPDGSDGPWELKEVAREAEHEKKKHMWQYK